MSRRAVLGLGGAALVWSSLRAEPAQARASAAPDPEAVLGLLKPEIRPRSAWGADLAVTGEILAEDDVRFLLVHHTASTNDYGPDEVVDQIREFHRFHTGPEKGWPDVAYNFFVDRFGGIWEARAGSIDGPVRGDATGGSQGFALLCSLIGDHSRVEVSPEATESLVRLLAWLAERHDIDTTPGASVDFVSRGSNRWPAGAAVTAATISGHRDMSTTSCPGDFAYGLLATELPTRVSAARRDAVAAVAPQPSPTEAPSVTLQPQEQAARTGATGALEGASSSTVDRAETGALSPTAPGSGDDGPLTVVIGAAATMTAVLVAGALALRRRVS